MGAAFSSRGGLPFFVAFELSLVPICLLILFAGGRPERQEAALYMSLYTLLGGGLHVLGLVSLFGRTGRLWWGARARGIVHPAIWGALLVSLLVKIPSYGFHLWLPKAHVEAPTGSRMVLAAVMLKLGTYGILAYSSMLLLSPTKCVPIFILGLYGLVICGPVILTQPDIKRLAAYRSVLHIASAMCVISTQTPLGTQAGMLVSIGHGFASSCVFAVIGVVHRLGLSRNPLLLGGLRSVGSGLFTLVFATIFLANGTPPFFSFWGEVVSFVHLGSWGGSIVMVALVFCGVVCPAAYFLAFFRAVSGATPAASKTLVPPSASELFSCYSHIFTLVFMFFMPGAFLLSTV